MFSKKKVLYKTNIPMTGFIAGLMFVLSLCSWSYTYAGEAAISKESVDILTKVGQATAEIVDAVRPAIVNISTTRTFKFRNHGIPLCALIAVKS